MSNPTCICKENYTGNRCEEKLNCTVMCRKRGLCPMDEDDIICRCASIEDGAKCQQLSISDVVVEKQIEDQTKILWPIITILVLIFLGIGIGVAYKCRKGTSFQHERLEENDINNPAYQDRDAEPFALDTDTVSVELINFQVMKMI